MPPFETPEERRARIARLRAEATRANREFRARQIPPTFKQAPSGKNWWEYRASDYPDDQTFLTAVRQGIERYISGQYVLLNFGLIPSETNRFADNYDEGDEGLIHPSVSLLKSGAIGILNRTTSAERAAEQLLGWRQGEVDACLVISIANSVG